MNAPDAARVHQQMAIEVVGFHGICKQGKLTRDAYRSKRKRLQDALASGALSQGNSTRPARASRLITDGGVLPTAHGGLLDHVGQLVTQDLLAVV